MTMCIEEAANAVGSLDWNREHLPSALVVGLYAFSRAGISLHLERDGIRVAGEASDFDEASAMARKLGPSLIFFDLFEVGREQFNLIGRVKSEFSEIKVGVFVRDPSTDHLKQALRAGVSAFITKGAPMIAPLRLIVRHMLDGGLVVDPRLMADFVSGIVWSHIEPTRDETSVLMTLTERDRLILRLVAHGDSATDIAAAMNVAPGTVRNRLTAIYRLINVTTRSEAAAFAVRCGLAS